VVKILKKIGFIFLVSLLFMSCARYRQNILFQVNEESVYDSLVVQSNELEKNYIIKANDFLNVSVYTSNGEVLIDPESKYASDGGGNANSTQADNGGGLKYLVDANGFVNLPMLGKIKIDSLTIPQADSILSLKYGEYYQKCFVLTKCVNRRVTVLGANGGAIVPIENENTTLIEIIAKAGGVSNSAKATNIRLVRGEGVNQKIAIIDLTTVEGIKLANLKVENHDIIYVEPVRKVLNEAIQDITPILSIFTSLITLAVVLIYRR
jgi:polysaccharide biosynthesis/export protein